MNQPKKLKMTVTGSMGANNTAKLIGAAAGQLASEITNTGLSWDESIAMLGLTAKIVAAQANAQDPENTFDLAERRLSQGWSANVDLKFSAPVGANVH